MTSIANVVRLLPALRAPGESPNSPLADVLAEAALCETCFDVDALRSVSSLVTPDDFYSPEGGALFAAQLALARRGAEVSPASVRRELGDVQWKRTEAWLERSDLARNEVAGSADTFAQIVVEYARRRAVLAGLEAAIQATLGTPVRTRAQGDLEDAIAEPLERVRSALARRGGEARALVTGGEDGEVAIGPPTGIEVLDRTHTDGRPWFRGWSPGLHVLAARSGQGKTVWGLSMAANVAAGGDHALIVSLEMPAAQLRARVLRNLAAATRDGTITADVFDAARSRIHVLDYTGDRKVEQSRVLDDMRRLRERLERGDERLALSVLDYLQHRRWLLGRSKFDAIEEALDGLVTLGIEGFSTLALSQFNREADSADARPTRAMLFGSSHISMDAVSVCFLHRPKGAEPTSDGHLGIDLIVDKQRHGPAGTTFELDWDLTNYRIRDSVVGGYDAAQW